MTNLKLHEDCKVLSQAVYEEKKPKNINGWQYKGLYSNNRNGYYSEVYEKGNKVILVVRGTDTERGTLECAKDLKNDYDMSWALLPKQANDAKNTYLDLIKKYGRDNIIVTGHSLGGSLGQILGTEYGVETVTFEAYGIKYAHGLKINYTENITNYGNAKDTIFTKNIDSQIGKVMVLNSDGEGDSFKKKYFSFAGRAPHSLENLGDLSKAVEYKKEVFEQNNTPLFKTGIEYIDYSDDVFDTKNRVLYAGEVPIEDMDEELIDVFLDQYFDNDKMPTKEDLDRRVYLGGLIYVKEYTRSDGTKVSGYYRRP